MSKAEATKTLDSFHLTLSDFPPATQSGRWIKTLEGYRAFLPNPLPPRIEWTQPLAVALANASTLVGKLGGEGKRLPNPHVLIRPFVRRKAVYSSRIEGTQSNLGELLAAEAGAAVARSPDDLREVGGFRKVGFHWRVLWLLAQPEKLLRAADFASPCGGAHQLGELFISNPRISLSATHTGTAGTAAFLQVLANAPFRRSGWTFSPLVGQRNCEH